MAQLRELRKSIENPANILHDDTRNRYRVIMVGKGPRAKADGGDGNFCFAFKLERNSSAASSYPQYRCYRVWKQTPSTSDMTRYSMISEYLRSTGLSYFLDYGFAPRALKVDTTGEILPGTYMEWIEGMHLHQYLSEVWKTMPSNRRLAFVQSVVLMFHRLRLRNISHGDLSCRNILVMPRTGDIKLVDYDSLYVPSMGTKYRQTTGGVGGFQHPLRVNDFDHRNAGLDDDNFASLVITLSLLVAYYEPSALDSYDESHLLFDASDFNGENGAQRLRTLHNSRGWALASKVAATQPVVKDIMAALENVSGTVESIPSICSVISLARAQSENFPYEAPRIVRRNVAYCTTCGHHFKDITESFIHCPYCGAMRHSYTTQVN